MSEQRANLAQAVFDVRQPPVPAESVARSAGALLAYRVMAFVTGVVLLAGTIALILKYAANVDFGAVYGILWVAHGWLFIVYLITTLNLGVRLRWPIARFVLVGLSGTIPTMSFVAEHFVTRATRQAAQPVSVRD
jgi:integral membrane protein